MFETFVTFGPLPLIPPPLSRLTVELLLPPASSIPFQLMCSAILLPHLAQVAQNVRPIFDLTDFDRFWLEMASNVLIPCFKNFGYRPKTMSSL